jgi:hypothetical protein
MSENKLLLKIMGKYNSSCEKPLCNSRNSTYMKASSTIERFYAGAGRRTSFHVVDRVICFKKLKNFASLLVVWSIVIFVSYVKFLPLVEAWPRISLGCAGLRP